MSEHMGNEIAQHVHSYNPVWSTVLTLNIGTRDLLTILILISGEKMCTSTG